MKYWYTRVLIPWYDTDGMKQWTTIEIKDIIDRRRLYRGIRKFIYQNFNKKVSKQWIKVMCPIQYYDCNIHALPKFSSDDMNRLCLAIMKETEEYEANQQRPAVLQAGTPESTEV